MDSITIYEGKPVHVRAHLRKGDLTSLQKAEVDSITAKLFDLRSDTPHTPLSTDTLTIDDVLFDTGLTAGWKGRGTYNFLYVAPGLLMDKGGWQYRWQIEFDGVSEDDDDWIVFNVKTIDLIGE